jgi:predicted RNase H-like HicB family nuclease
MLKRFKVILEWDSEGQAYHVSVPALPGCVTFGVTREIALERIQEAIEGHLEALKDAGLPPTLHSIQLNIK